MCSLEVFYPSTKLSYHYYPTAKQLFHTVWVLMLLFQKIIFVRIVALNKRQVSGRRIFGMVERIYKNGISIKQSTLRSDHFE